MIISQVRPWRVSVGLSWGGEKEDSFDRGGGVRQRAHTAVMWPYVCARVTGGGEQAARSQLISSYCAAAHKIVSTVKTSFDKLNSIFSKVTLHQYRKYKLLLFYLYFECVKSIIFVTYKSDWTDQQSKVLMTEQQVE